MISFVASVILTASIAYSQTNQPALRNIFKVEGEWILGPTLKWPLKGSDGSLWPSPESGKLLTDRWANGELANLSTDDSATVRKIVLDKLPNTDPKVGKIKKI